MHTTRVLGIGKVFTTALLSLQAKNMLTPGQPVAVKSFFLKCTNPPSRVSSSSLGRGSAVPSGVVCGVQLMLVSTPVRVTRPPTAGPGYLRCRCLRGGGSPRTDRILSELVAPTLLFRAPPAVEVRTTPQGHKSWVCRRARFDSGQSRASKSRPAPWSVRATSQTPWCRRCRATPNGRRVWRPVARRPPATRWSARPELRGRG